MAYTEGSNTIIGRPAVSGVPSVFHTSFPTSPHTTLAPSQVRLTDTVRQEYAFFGGDVAVGNGRIAVGASYYDGGAIDTGRVTLFNSLTYNPIQSLTGSDVGARSRFGVSVALGSGRLAVGAPAFSATFAGKVYVFDIQASPAVELVKITSPEGFSGDAFGAAVDIGCGKIVVGARSDQMGKGKAYLYNLNGTLRSDLLAQIPSSFQPTESNLNFGKAVAVNQGRIVVGAPGKSDNGSDSGAIYIFDLVGNFISFTKPAEGAAGDLFGTSVAIGCGKIIVGAPGNSGAAYIFDLNGNQQARISGPLGSFGDVVSVGSGLIAVGAPTEFNNAPGTGTAYVYDLAGNLRERLTDSPFPSAFDAYGASVDIGDGRVVVGVYADSFYDANVPTLNNAGTAVAYSIPRTLDIYFEDVLENFRY